MGGLPRTGLVACAVELLLHLFMEKPRNESATFPEQNSAHSKKELDVLSSRSAGSAWTSFNLHCTS